jgi:hypothetical protein
MANFTKLHTAIVGAFKSAYDQFKKLEVATVTTQNKAITALVDAHIVACTTTKAEYLKGNSVKNDARREVKELFESLAKAEYISQKSATQYQTCFWIAFEKGIPFSRDLVNVKAKAKADSAKAESVKAGKVEVTTHDGRHLAGRVDEPKGDPGNTLSRQEITDKALRLAAFSGGATPEAMRQSVDALWQVATWPKVGALLP